MPIQKFISHNWLNAKIVFLTIISLGLPVTVQGAALKIEEIAHVYTIAQQKSDTRLYLATRHGLYTTKSDGQATLLARKGDSFTSFAIATHNKNIMYASGKSASADNLGLLRSNDAGKTWQRIDTDTKIESNYQNLVISPSDRKTLYATFKGLQVSHDSGQHWTSVAAEPKGMIGFSVSAKDSKLLYAATRTGLLESKDGGKNWRDTNQFTLPVTMVQTTADGGLYAFVVTRGLLHRATSSSDWREVNNQFGAQILLRLFPATENMTTFYAVNQNGKPLISSDKGKSWHRLSTPSKPTNNKMVRAGEELFLAYCQTCHGLQGVGENFTVQSLTEKNYIIAPPLNDSAHAWHHSDKDLMTTIMEGSPRASRMVAWKKLLSKQNAQQLVAYIKSLWGKRELDCQGPKHMKCK
ncbi:MAG: c-type cytochrome [Thiohalomonadales bacterium]